SGFVNGISPSNLTFPPGTTYLAFVNTGGVTAFADNGLPSSALYNYAVIAFNWDGVHSQTINYHTSGTIKTASSYTLPQAPVALAASSISQSGFTANWNSVSGALSYALDLSTDNFATFVSGYNNLTVTGTTSIITGLSTGTAYKYRV